MEHELLIVIVGFLGAGKTTLLKQLVQASLEKEYKPFILLNDYENANLDAQWFRGLLAEHSVSALSGSCICCSGLPQLRATVNAIPERPHGITFIEANGTTDACALLGFLGIGLRRSFSPPVQIGVVDARHWQTRGMHNELEANQVQASSLVLLNYADQVSEERLGAVRQSVLTVNPQATVVPWQEFDFEILHRLRTVHATSGMEHHKAHWSSCSVALRERMSSGQLGAFLEALPEGILRVKGCTRLNDDEHYTFFETIPSGEVTYRDFRGSLVSGPMLLAIGPGSDPAALRQLAQQYC